VPRMKEYSRGGKAYESIPALIMKEVSKGRKAKKRYSRSQEAKKQKNTCAEDERNIKRQKNIRVPVLRMKEYPRDGKHKNTCAEDERILKRRKSI